MESAANNLVAYTQNEKFRGLLLGHGPNPKFKKSACNQLSLIRARGRFQTCEFAEGGTVPAILQGPHRKVRHMLGGKIIVIPLKGNLADVKCDRFHVDNSKARSAGSGGT